MGRERKVIFAFVSRRRIFFSAKAPQLQFLFAIKLGFHTDSLGVLFSSQGKQKCGTGLESLSSHYSVVHTSISKWHRNPSGLIPKRHRDRPSVLTSLIM